MMALIGGIELLEKILVLVSVTERLKLLLHLRLLVAILGHIAHRLVSVHARVNLMRRRDMNVVFIMVLYVVGHIGAQF